MTAIRPRRNTLLLSAVTLLAVLTLSCAPPLFAYAQETVTTTTTEEDVTDLDDVGDAMADLTQDDMLEGDEIVTAIEDTTAEEESCDDEAAATAAADDATVDATTTTTATEESKTDDDQQSTTATATSEQGEQQATTTTTTTTEAPPTQSGPFIDLFGDVLLSLEMVDETHAQVHQHYTNEILSGKKVVGLYFSADWCGPCRQFTPDLVNFYDKMNARRGKKDEFEIIWVSRCRDVDSFGQYFTHMKWLALPPQEAMGQRGQYLGEKYKVKSIPTLVLLDEIGNVITTDARNKIPMDKAGIGFPWRSPMSVLVSTLVPKSFRLLVKTQIAGVLDKVKAAMRGGGGAAAAAR